MSRVYINDSSSQIGISDNCLQIKTKDGVTKNVPVETVEGISVFGQAQISSQCIGECLRRGINIQYYSPSGLYFGRLSSSNHVNTFRQKRQVFLSDNEDFKLVISKKIIEAKIKNQITVLRRYARNTTIDINANLKSMQSCCNRLDICNEIDEIMGYEGNAARIYYETLSSLSPPVFQFKKRTRRPPLDPFNSMLSFGYAILLNEVFGALESKGLNPFFGFLHADREKHPTLASDLMEEWRAVIVDSVVMSLIRGNEIEYDNFRESDDGPGIFIDRDGIKTIIKKLENKFMTKSSYLDYIDYQVSFRRAIELQAGQLAKAIEEENPNIYLPVVIR